MGIKLSPRAGVQVSGATAVEIDHANDSISLGDGVNLLEFLEASPGVWAIPVKPIGAGDASAANQTSGDQKSQLWDDTLGAAAEVDDVGGEKALKVSVISTVGGGGSTADATDKSSFTASASLVCPIGGQYDADESSTLTDGQFGMVGLTSTRHMKVAVQNMTGYSTSAKQDTIIGHVDGIETSLTTLLGYVDGLEGYLDQVEGYLDGVETLIGTTNTNTGNAATSLAIIDDWDATAGAAHPADGVMAMGSDGTLARRLKTDSNGELQVDVLSMPTVAVTGTFWQATQPVSGTFWQATQPVSLASLPALAAGTNNIGDVDVLTLPSLPAGNNNIGDVDIATMPDVTAVGKAAHDAAVSGNPVLNAGRAQNTTPTSVANGDVCYMATDLAGRLITQSYAPREMVVTGNATLSTTTETTLIAAAASTFHDLVFLMFTNTSSTATRVDVRDTTSGTVLFSVALAANGGAVIPFPTPIPQTTVNTNWRVQLSGAVTDVRCYGIAVKRV